MKGEGGGERGEGRVVSGQLSVVSSRQDPRPKTENQRPSSFSPRPSPPHDAAVLPVAGPRLAFTTDRFVVHPLFFPGGDIGKLAVYGTVNDLAMAGAKPAYLSAGFILEEGLPMDTLRRVVASMAEAARAAGVRIVTGDTKVVDRGKADGIFINTAGIGWVPPGVEISPARVRPGDAILLSGDLGRHGMAIMSVREGLRSRGLESDCAPLAGLVEAMLAAGRRHPLPPRPDARRAGRGAQRNRPGRRRGHRNRRGGDSGGRAGGGGLRTAGARPALCGQRGPAGGVRAGRRGRARAGGHASHPRPRRAGRIGVVTDGHAGLVELRSRFGGGRIVDLLSGEQMPRIC